MEKTKTLREITIVSGLWDINRPEREFQEFYIPRFLEFLKIDANLFLFIPSYLVDLVWEHRTKENTHIQVLELEDLREGLYKPHWELTEEIRQNQQWQNITGECGWLKESPQATLEYYNPIVQSKMFMLHDASIYNIFDTDLFYWIDAGITKTVAPGYLEPEKYLDKLPELKIPFLFLSYPYLSKDEIHGFSMEGMKKYCESDVEYVCRGGFFGGTKDAISKANALYYHLLQSTLTEGFMGTEESIFTIMAYLDPVEYRRYMLDDNGLILKFFDALGNKNVNLEPIPATVHTTRSSKDTSEANLAKLSTNLYILTFNFPEQLVHTIESMKKTPDLLQKPNLFLLDNSTDNAAKEENKRIAEANKFSYIDLGGNRGINGGRQAAAEHFEASDADFMFFFEDDMTVNPPEYIGQFCRNGFRKYIPNLYQIVHKIMLKESFDFLKLSFTEVYWDNNIQTSWYNVPQHIRTEVWPSYDKLPVTGTDPNSPRTKFDKINNVDGLAYITGEIFYCNWPMIVSKEGNRKMFIDTKWAHPYEQTWMSHMYQLTKKGELRPAVLLGSPIWHDRIKHYPAQERREN